MLKELQSVKEQLFDAPIEVKESFNSIVKYFADANKYRVVEVFYPGDDMESRLDIRGDFGPTGVKGNKGEYIKRRGSVIVILDGPFNTKEEAKKVLDKRKETYRPTKGVPSKYSK